MIAYIHGDIGAVHSLSDDLSIVNEDTAHRSFIRGQCQLSLIREIRVSGSEDLLMKSSYGIGESAPC